jgi:hypothetical protein
LVFAKIPLTPIKKYFHNLTGPYKLVYPWNVHPQTDPAVAEAK